MTPEQVTLVQNSFAKVAPVADKAADMFYGRLFELAPQVRAMFPDELAPQKKKLMQALTLAVNSLTRPDQLMPVLRDMGARHVGYGAQEAHYDVVGAALIDTLDTALGADFDDATREAWVACYAIVAGEMKMAARRAA